jgi:peptidoglycan hydrolase CwlO-like protein
MKERSPMKKRIIAAVLLFCIVLSAHAAGTRLTLDSEKSMASQIRDFKAWYQSLNAKEQAQWDEAFQELKEKGSGITYFAASVQDTSEKMVWIPKSGKKYHKVSTCSNMNNPMQVAVSTATSRGYTPCKKCKP